MDTDEEYVVGDTLESIESGELYILTFVGGEFFEIYQPKRDVALDLPFEKIGEFFINLRTN